MHVGGWRGVDRVKVRAGVVDWVGMHTRDNGIALSSQILLTRI